MQKLPLAILFTIFCLSGYSQDTIQLINGKKIVASAISIEADKIAYRKTSNNKLKKIDPYKVFSVLYKDGTENVVFSPDTLDPLDFKVEEMRSFIKGEQDARVLYRTYLVPVIGVGVGAVSGTFAIYGLVGPPLYSTMLGLFNPNIDKQLSFHVKGDGAEALGIKPGKYLNEVSSTNSVMIKKDQSIKINNKKFRFSKDTDVNEAVSIINSKFNCSRVHATSDAGKLKLYKASSASLINDNSYREGYSKKVREKRITSGLISGFAGFLITAVTLAIVN